MSKTCPIIDGRARQIDEHHYNLYCALFCEAEFPPECDGICGWPDMKQASLCPVRTRCPCRTVQGMVNERGKLNFVQEAHDKCLVKL